MLILEVMGDQIVFTFSMMSRVMVLYVVVSVSFDLPPCVVVSALSVLFVCVACFRVFSMCAENVSF